jgi:hypothetical protein
VHVEGYSSVVDLDGRFDEVEENLSWTMRFPSGIVASCNTTYGEEGVRDMQLMADIYRSAGLKAGS